MLTYLIPCTFRYIFHFLVECCISNAYVFERYYRPGATVASHQNQKSYRLSLAESLIGSYNSRFRYAVPEEVHDVALLKSLPPKKRRKSLATSPLQMHYPIKGIRGKCAYCSRNNLRHESVVRCRQCKVTLCTHSQSDDGRSCFEKYHL